MSDYEIAIRKWAAHEMTKVHQTPNFEKPSDWLDIVNVRVEMDPGDAGWSSWTPGTPPTFRINADMSQRWMDDNHYQAGQYVKLLANNDGDYDADQWSIDFDTLFAEILAIEVTDDDRARWAAR